MRIGPQIVPFAGNNIAPIKNRKKQKWSQAELDSFSFLSF
jgi:hypothetical protein